MVTNINSHPALHKFLMCEQRSMLLKQESNEFKRKIHVGNEELRPTMQTKEPYTKRSKNVQNE